MLFHIQSTHSYQTCGANDPEKKKLMRSAFHSAEEKGIKIHSLVMNRPSHTKRGMEKYNTNNNSP